MTPFATSRVVRLGVYDTLADWEVGHVLAELRSGRFTGTRFEIVTVAESLDPVTTMGGVRILPDMALSGVRSARRRDEGTRKTGRSFWGDRVSRVVAHRPPDSERVRGSVDVFSAGVAST